MDKGLRMTREGRKANAAVAAKSDPALGPAKTFDTLPNADAIRSRADDRRRILELAKVKPIIELSDHSLNNMDHEIIDIAYRFSRAVARQNEILGYGSPGT